MTPLEAERMLIGNMRGSPAGVDGSERLREMIVDRGRIDSTDAMATADSRLPHEAVLQRCSVLMQVRLKCPELTNQSPSA